MSNTTTTKPSLFVKYPGLGYSTIRNDPPRVWQYIFAVAPHLYAEAGQCRKLAGRNGWQYDEARARAACMLIIEGKVKRHDEPHPVTFRIPFVLRDVHYELAQVDGFSVRALGASPRSKLYCTCHDYTAPKSAAADYTCSHIIAWALSGTDAK